ncbi:glycosyltransferase family 39 protein [Actinomadura alba]|uniref:Glycosyltransferase family 39 protein n=1 Tax=Actinomadura alba TaxID=406431 RepID=A0ABR7LNK7_9ACTN|nr:glycosyltransferase family 39 protein [Actinomadura alba]
MTDTVSPAPTTDRPKARSGESPHHGLLRRAVLGRPEDPRWARPVLWGILVLATALYTWNLSAGGNANSYYAAAVLSATKSWKAFFFGSLDAGSFITIDKPPMALWLMALSGRILGFGPWSMLLPQAAAGVAAVGVLYTAVRRHHGHLSATISALVMALSPITVAINRDNNPDPLLVLFLVLAAWACLTAIRTGALLPLLGSAVAIGCAFNTKMLQAYLVLPVFALGYLLFAPPSFARRFARLLLAGAVLAVSSFWWMIVVDLIPAASRPYVGGSRDGTVWDLVVGYNGLGRVFGGEGPTFDGGGGGGASFGGVPGAGRLFNEIVGGQISWLLPFAVIALIAGVALRGRAPRTDAVRASLALWGGWLAVHYAVFSFAQGTFHPYYVTAMSPAIAALAGAGEVMLFDAHRRVGRRAGRLPLALSFALPFGLAVTGAWSFVLLRRTPSWNPWLGPVVVAVTSVAVVTLIVARLAPRLRTRAAVVGVSLGLAAVLAGPGAYAVAAAHSRVNGVNPLAAPATGGGLGGPGGGRMPGSGAAGAVRPGGWQGGGPPEGRPPGDAPRGVGMPGGGPAGGGMRGGPPGETVDAGLISYLRKNEGNATWLVAVSSAQSASSIILETGRPVIAMGGFTGSDPAMTVEKLRGYVTAGKLRYVMTGDRRLGRGGDTTLTTWIEDNCKVVQASEYGGNAGAASSATSGSTSTFPDSGRGPGRQQLYDCA